MKAGTIVILMGASASGKSTIQKCFQKTSEAFYIKIGIDTFFDALLPETDLSSFAQTKELWQKTTSGELIRGIYEGVDEEGKSVIPLVVGPAGQRVIFGMHHAIAAYAAQGNNIIVDYILYDPAWLPDLCQALKNHTVYLIGIKTPLNILEEREISRSTSPLGHARSHHTFHTHITYDLELDTSSLTPEQCAAHIHDFIRTHPHPTALYQL